jgi:hypothetical protein
MSESQGTARSLGEQADIREYAAAGSCWCKVACGQVEFARSHLTG